MQAVFARGKEGSDKKSELPLYINNCGYYRGVTHDLPIERPEGRSDHHLVFAVEGEIETAEGTARAGECVLYRPGEPQRYRYRAGKETSYLWVHFSGREAYALLGSHRSGGILSYRENAAEVHELLFRAVHAIAAGMEQADLYAEGLLRAALALTGCTARKREPFSRAVAMMKELTVHRTVKEYAAASGMSEGHFIRAFKKAYGVTPLEYRTVLQLDCARNLLVGTPLRVGAVASIAGFSDALYFSRLFRKRTGMSPSEYREHAGMPETKER